MNKLYKLRPLEAEQAVQTQAQSVEIAKGKITNLKEKINLLAPPSGPYITAKARRAHLPALGTGHPQC